MDAEEVIERLGLEPLPQEGGFFRATHRSAQASHIYYLVTPESFSALHRLPQDEVFHFYAGDPVEMVQIYPDGELGWFQLGNDVAQGHNPQMVVPGNTWQGLRLVSGGRWALLGCTVAPPFEYALYEHGQRGRLTAEFPQHGALIAAFTRE